MSQRTDLVVLAIIRQGDHILMVQQYDGPQQAPYWVLPGGLVEPGELVNEALVREVREESGIAVTGIGHLAYITQIDRPSYNRHTTVFVFEVANWHGTLGHNDPDNEIVDVAFVPLAEAIIRLQNPILWRGMAGSVAAYLSGQAAAGTVWCYRQHNDTPEQRLVQCIAAQASSGANAPQSTC